MELPANCPKWLVAKSLQEYLKIIFFTMFFQFLGFKFRYQLCIYHLISLIIDGFFSTMFFDCIRWIIGPNLCKDTIHRLWIHLPWCWWWCLVYVHQTFQWVSVGTTAWVSRVHPIPDILYASGRNPIWNLEGWKTFETTSQLTSFLQVRNRMQ